MLAIAIAGLVLLGTSIQMVLAIQDLRATRREALDWMHAEDELVQAERPWRRRRTRRELRSWRDPDTHHGIRHVNAVLASWLTLVLASAAALAAAITHA